MFFFNWNYCFNQDGGNSSLYAMTLAQNLKASAEKSKMKRNFTFTVCCSMSRPKAHHEINKRMASKQDQGFGVAQFRSKSNHGSFEEDCTQELKWFCKEGWQHIAKSRSTKMIDSYSKRVGAMIKI